MTPVSGIGIGVLLALLGLPLILKRVPRFRLYGLRTPLAFKSDAIWQEANRRSGWDMLLAGAGIVVLSLWVSRSGAFGEFGRDFLTVSVIVALVATCLRACIVASRLGGTDRADG